MTGKDVIVALCGILSNDEVLNHAIEFPGSEDTMRSLPVDARLTIANVSYVFRALIFCFVLHSELQDMSREYNPPGTCFKTQN